MVSIVHYCPSILFGWWMGRACGNDRIDSARCQCWDSKFSVSWWGVHEPLGIHDARPEEYIEGKLSRGTVDDVRRATRDGGAMDVDKRFEVGVGRVGGQVSLMKSGRLLRQGELGYGTNPL